MTPWSKALDIAERSLKEASFASSDPVRLGARDALAEFAREAGPVLASMGGEQLDDVIAGLSSRYSCCKRRGRNAFAARRAAMADLTAEAAALADQRAAAWERLEAAATKAGQIVLRAILVGLAA